ncbi:TIGR02452 family protein [Nioella aestuarii]|uniref:TIGR02452 family protein n=1 Tax=Nioella aestuarii TaxID=1662864 RepID=UPI003D7FDC43
MASRDHYRSIARANSEAFDLGLYEAVDGTIVDIAETLKTAARRTQLVDRPPLLPDPLPQYTTRMTLSVEDTLSGLECVTAEIASPVCGLNFASARSPGGGYLRGGSAQEESLCRATTLYPAIAAQEGFYKANKAWPNAIYSDAMLYSPDVLVIRDRHELLRPDPFPVGIVTAAAPNKKALIEAGMEAKLGQEVDLALSRRVDCILRIALAQGHRAIVLGAWGCGVFGNDADQVAGLFADALSGPFRGCFERVHFAVPGDENDKTLIAFRRHFASR